MAAKIDQLINEISNLTALELAQLTKELETKFGVTAAAPMGGFAAAPAEAGSAKKEEEKDSFKIELIDAGSDKIKAIKAVRQVKKDLGLTEAKKMVEELPSVLAESASKDEAKTIKEIMEAAGAKVKLS